MDEFAAPALTVHTLQPATDQLECIASHASAGGCYRRYRHWSTALQCDMAFGVFFPPQMMLAPCPSVWWLSGITCTDENFMQKAGAHRVAAERGLVIICPDTSPRGTGTAGEDERINLGTGAGFYVNATQPPWQRHYRMYDYVTEELPQLLSNNFPRLNQRASIMGHSMGGLGALVCALRLPERYHAISAFAPMAHPTAAPWGRDAFQAYLGDDPEQWEEYDPCALVRNIDVNRNRLPIFIDQGDADPFLAAQLRVADFEEACRAHGYPLTLRYRPGYDHSYFFVASFIDEHLHRHADLLLHRDDQD